ncbi:MAG: hypothetical protein OSA93_02450 [Akkermansiaceae bacterium]|nr:hypothetical protein [Akkermansiaceae bacterium]
MLDPLRSNRVEHAIDLDVVPQGHIGKVILVVVQVPGKDGIGIGIGSARVPVLSRAIVSICANSSIALPPRNNTPCFAPHAIPARIADGIDNTSAHGLATAKKAITR